MLITDNQIWQQKHASFSQPEARIAIVSDFDHTLTIFRDASGARAVQSISCLRALNLLTEEYTEEAEQLFQTYFPYDNDPMLSLEEKGDLWCEWWQRHYALMLREGLSTDSIRKAAESEAFQLREGTEGLIAMCGLMDIPFIVLSAGLGDVIHALFTQRGLQDAVGLVANFFEFDAQGRGVRHLPPLIHSLSKHHVPLELFPLALQQSPPTHVIVIGDHIGDSMMAGAFPEADVLRVGILDEQTMDRLSEYQQHFDLLLFGNDSLEPVHAFLESVTAPTAV